MVDGWCAILLTIRAINIWFVKCHTQQRLVFRTRPCFQQARTEAVACCCFRVLAAVIR